MNDDEFNKLTDAYIRHCHAAKKSAEYEANLWAWEWVFEAIHGTFDGSTKDAETVWRFILAVLEKDTGDPVLALLGAGPLEDLLAQEGNTFIQRVELQARQDPKFRHLLGGVWKNAMTDTIWQRVQTARLHKSW